MTPWGSDQMCGPDGNAQYGFYDQSAQIHAGALVARIGGRGAIFKVGSKHTFTAKAAGRLFFAIGMNPSYINYAYPGEYEVKVKVEPK